MANAKKVPVDRRDFLKSAMVGTARMLVSGEPAPALQGGKDVPGNHTPADVDVLTTDHPGADFMVDVIKTLGSNTSLPIPDRVFGGCMNRDQLRRQQRPRIHHLLSRRVVGRNGPWLLENRR